MRAHRFLTAGLVVLAMLAFTARSAHVQTTAIGPYYATPSWSQKIACTSASNCPRFVVLSNWNSEAVLDRETGVVWERSPSTVRLSWTGAQDDCLRLGKGGRRGWRLPTISELSSLVDPSVPPDQVLVVLPPGNPFGDLQGDLPDVPSSYWSGSSHSGLSNHAWVMRLSDGAVAGAPTNSFTYRWCVRGGQGVQAP